MQRPQPIPHLFGLLWRASCHLDQIVSARGRHQKRDRRNVERCGKRHQVVHVDRVPFSIWSTALCVSGRPTSLSFFARPRSPRFCFSRRRLTFSLTVSAVAWRRTAFVPMLITLRRKLVTSIELVSRTHWRKKCTSRIQRRHAAQHGRPHRRSGDEGTLPRHERPDLGAIAAQGNRTDLHQGRPQGVLPPRRRAGVDRQQHIHPHRPPSRLDTSPKHRSGH